MFVVASGMSNLGHDVAVIYLIALGVAFVAVFAWDAVRRRGGPGWLGVAVWLAPTAVAAWFGGVEGALVYLFFPGLPVLGAVRLWQWSARHIAARRKR